MASGHYLRNRIADGTIAIVERRLDRSSAPVRSHCLVLKVLGKTERRGHAAKALELRRTSQSHRKAADSGGVSPGYRVKW